MGHMRYLDLVAASLRAVPGASTVACADCRRRAACERHVAAQRNLFNRMGMLFHCLQNGHTSDEAIAFPQPPVGHIAAAARRLPRGMSCGQHHIRRRRGTRRRAITCAKAGASPACPTVSTKAKGRQRASEPGCESLWSVRHGTGRGRGLQVRLLAPPWARRHPGVDRLASVRNPPRPHMLQSRLIRPVPGGVVPPAVKFCYTCDSDEPHRPSPGTKRPGSRTARAGRTSTNSSCARRQAAATCAAGSTNAPSILLSACPCPTNAHSRDRQVAVLRSRRPRLRRGETLRHRLHAAAEVDDKALGPHILQCMARQAFHLSHDEDALDLDQYGARRHRSPTTSMLSSPLPHRRPPHSPCPRAQHLPLYRRGRWAAGANAERNRGCPAVRASAQPDHRAAPKRSRQDPPRTVSAAQSRISHLVRSSE